MTAIESHETDKPAWSQAPGASLRAAREARRLDIDKIAVELHLSRAMVEAIERDDYEGLPGSVFVRGYLKSYARLVGLSVSHILNAYEARRPEETIATPVVKKSVRSEVSSGHAGVRLVTWGIVLILIGLVVVWWRGYIDWSKAGRVLVPERTPPREPPALVLPPQGPDLPNISAGGGGPTGSAPVLTPPSEGPTAAPSPGAAPAQPSSQQAASSEAPPAQSTQTAAEAPVAESKPTPRVVFHFSAACWVDIRDSTGRFKIAGLVKKNTTRVAEGVPPWSVVLGNSRAVSITVDGRSFDHSRYVSGNVARFKLNPEAP